MSAPDSVPAPLCLTPIHHHNQIRLSAKISEIKALRYTPAGIPVLELELEHESEQTEQGENRKVQIKGMKALGFGAVAEALQKNCQLGRLLHIEGFLAAPRSGKGLRLHIQRYRLEAQNIQAEPSDTQ